jgi:hypothetical protein
MSNEIKVGDRVRITETFFSLAAERYGHEDSYPGLIGAVGTVTDFRAGDEAARLELDERFEGWSTIYVPATGVEHVEETKFKVGDRVRIVSSSYTEHPSRKAGGTGTIDKVLDGELSHVLVDNDPDGSAWAFWVSELEPLTEEPEQVEDKPAFEVGDLVSIGKDKSCHGFRPGTVARVLKVYNDPDDKTLYVTTRPVGDEDPVWEQGVTAYVNYAPDSEGDEDDVRLVAKAGTVGAVLWTQPVTYQEFVDVVVREGLVSAFERFNITWK